MYLLFQAVALDGVEDLDKVVLAGGFQDLKRNATVILPSLSIIISL